MTAAMAWDELAADLEGTASSYQTVIDNLTRGAWLGPSSTAMAAASATICRVAADRCGDRRPDWHPGQGGGGRL